MARSTKAAVALLASFAMLAVSIDALAQRSHGGGRSYSGHRHHGHHHGHRHHHHSRVSVGFVFGGPWWYPGPAYYPAYYPYYAPYSNYYPYPASVTVPAPVYVERDRDVAAADSPYWYYCRESDTYYPYVKQCPGPWERVPAQPAR